MAVVGVDIGDYNTFVSVARVGGVDTIANEYSQRNTPSIVSLGSRQRFMGVSAENQRNIKVKNTISYFKNFLGRSYKDPYIQNNSDFIGAKVVELKDGKVGFQVGDKTFVPEQILSMMLTKIKEIVRNDQNEDISNMVISVPSHFKQSQRHAVMDAAKIAGIQNVMLVDDAKAIAVLYGKTKTDLSEDDVNLRNVAVVDIGSGAAQCSIMSVSKNKVTILATSSSTSTGGKYLDQVLLDYVVTEIEKKYNVNIRINPKALNKIRVAVEKIKKQMSANASKLPFQIENLVDDVDISLSLDRSMFEDLIAKNVEELKRTLNDLLNSTTIKADQIHSVEMVGGSSRVPAFRNVIQDVVGIQPSSSLNADEAVSRGCGYLAASLSSKFKTRTFSIDDIITEQIEAVYTENGQQEKILIFDEGDKVTEKRSLKIKADLPLHLAVQYGENVQVDNKFITLYQIGEDERKDSDLTLVFEMSQDGLVHLTKVDLMSSEDAKRRKTDDNQLPESETQIKGDDTMFSALNVSFAETSLGGLPNAVINHLINEEKKMIEEDAFEVSRQEAKNLFEEELFSLREDIYVASEGIEEEENTKMIKDVFTELENWLYDEGEEASKDDYNNQMKTLKEKVIDFLSWAKQIKNKIEHEKRILQQQEDMQRRPQSSDGQSRQIPVVFENNGPFTQSRSASAGSSRPRNFQHPSQHEFRRYMMEDPFYGRQSFLSSPMFGYGW